MDNFDTIFEEEPDYDLIDGHTPITMTQDEMARERTDLSEARTGMAIERTALANSQTLLSYSRTAIATFAAGIGMFEFVNNDSIVKMGIALMMIAPVIEVIGIIHFIRVRRKLKKYDELNYR